MEEEKSLVLCPPNTSLKDRQLNRKNKNRLTYYVNADKMLQTKDKKIGFKVTARPQDGLDGFVYYNSAEFHSESIPIDKILAPNQTLIIDIVLRRHIDKEVFRLDSAQEPWKNFKDIEPCKENIET
ncbi:MAG: hypothetical protein NT096_07230 [Proteobacteria bacterium]|nr:hypothetical protein [Pseudomonadota bacterium]